MFLDSVFHKKRSSLLHYENTWNTVVNIDLLANEIQKEYSKKDVIIVGVNVDRDKKSMSRFLKKNNCDFLVLHDASKDLVSKIDIKSLPTSFIVAPNGIIESVHVGFNKKTTKKDYISSLNKLISEKSRKNGK